MELVSKIKYSSGLKVHLIALRKFFFRDLKYAGKGSCSYLKLLCTGSFVFFILFCTNYEALAQYEPQFSQNIFSRVVYNPAFAGSTGRTNLTALDRSQWVGMDDAPRTTVFGGDMGMNILGSKSGVGLIVMNDVAGFANTLTVSGLVSRHYFLDESLLSIGASVGFVNSAFDGTKLVFRPSDSNYHSETDPVVSKSKQTAITPDAGFGVSFIHPDFYAGISFLHLFAPNANFNDQLNVYIPRSFFLTAGYFYQFIENPIELRPSILVKKSGPAWQTDMNVKLYWQDRYWGGVTYRLEEAWAVMAGFELSNGIRVGYCYDISNSDLSRAGSNGTHEIMLGYSFDLSLEKRDKRYKSVRFL